MELIDLVAYIGGTLGLFLGVSFLSFAEIFEIFFEMIFLAIEHNAKKRSHKRKIEIEVKEIVDE